MYWVYYKHQPLRLFNTKDEALNFINKHLEQWQMTGLTNEKLSQIKNEITLNYHGQNIEF